MSHPPLRIAVLCDAPSEGWKAMDLVGEMLAREWSNTPADVHPTRVAVDLPRLARLVTASRTALNVDRLAGRFVSYPFQAWRFRGAHDRFHVVDHSYAQLVHVLPRSRTGVYCHDLDAFRCLFDAERHPRPAWFRRLASVVLRGMRAASVVFHSTMVVRREIERHSLLPAERLVRAPYGVSHEFDAIGRGDDGAVEALGPVAGRPFLLHVGSSLARKRLDVLFEAFARLRPRYPELRLVQQGADFDAEQRAHVERLRLGDALFQPASKHLERRTLAGLYRRAAVVLVTSESEGFGLPVIEALACGAIVVASDIPVLREVGGDATLYAPVGQPEAWAERVHELMSGRVPPPTKEMRLKQAGTFTWSEHARIILDAYRSLA